MRLLFLGPGIHLVAIEAFDGSEFVVPGRDGEVAIGAALRRPADDRRRIGRDAELGCAGGIRRNGHAGDGEFRARCAAADHDSALGEDAVTDVAGRRLDRHRLGFGGHTGASARAEHDHQKEFAHHSEGQPLPGTIREDAASASQ